MKNIDVLATRMYQAFLEHAPLRLQHQGCGGWIYRKVAYGPLLDMFILDIRSYHGGSSANPQAWRSTATDLLGREQLQWLKHELRGSHAQWKMTAANMPIGLCVPDSKGARGRDHWEVIVNGNDGAAIGRELEIVDPLRFVQRAGVRNTVWPTADVHYCVARHYSPECATFKDFVPFQGLIAGSPSTGSFGPNALDDTFGPQVMFQKAPLVQNSSPFAGYQFFDEIETDAQSRALTVTLRDLDGELVFSRELQPGGA